MVDILASFLPWSISLSVFLTGLCFTTFVTNTQFLVFLTNLLKELSMS